MSKRSSTNKCKVKFLLLFNTAKARMIIETSMELTVGIEGVRSEIPKLPRLSESP